MDLYMYGCVFSILFQGRRPGMGIHAKSHLCWLVHSNDSSEHYEYIWFIFFFFFSDLILILALNQLGYILSHLIYQLVRISSWRVLLLLSASTEQHCIDLIRLCDLVPATFYSCQYDRLSDMFLQFCAVITNKYIALISDHLC